VCLTTPACDTLGDAFNFVQLLHPDDSMSVFDCESSRETLKELQLLFSVVALSCFCDILFCRGTCIERIK